MPVHTRWHAVLAKPRCLPTPCASPCAPSRQAAEASCPTAVHPFVHTLFPSACGQRVGASARAGAVPAAAVCPGSDPGLPSLSRSCEPQEKRDDQRPCLVPERFPRDTWLRHSQQTSLHGTEAAGSFGGAGRGPTPPSSMAAPSGTPPRRCLRGVQSTTGLHTSGRKYTPVCAAARGPVSAAAETAPCWASPLPAGLPGDILAPHRLGNALEPTLRLASPPCPPGARQKAPAPLRSARATGSCHPPSPS